MLSETYIKQSIPASSVLMWQGWQPKMVPNRQWLDESESKQRRTIRDIFWPMLLSLATILLVW